MARTKASVGAKVFRAKSSKVRNAIPPTSNRPLGGGEKSSRSYSGGNPVQPRETPKWQKPITEFIFRKEPISKDDDIKGGCSSKFKPKRKIIYSDDENEGENKETDDDQDENKENKSIENVESQVYEYNETKGENEGDGEIQSQVYDFLQSPPKNRELDESIVLEPLTGENSHKLEEYYPKSVKGKGEGKKSLRNINNNTRNPLKRDLEDDPSEESQANKKMKV